MSLDNQKKYKGPPKMTLNELEQFYDKVLRWYKLETELNHAWFEPDAKEYIRKKGYTFDLVREKSGKTFYKVIKL